MEFFVYLIFAIVIFIGIPLEIYSFTTRKNEIKKHKEMIVNPNDSTVLNYIVAFKKTYNSESVIVLVNTANYPKEFNFAKSNGYSGIRGYATTDGTEVTFKGEKITMSSNSLVVLK